MEIRMLSPDEADKLAELRLDFFKVFYPEWTAQSPTREQAQMAARLTGYYREGLGHTIEAAAAFDGDAIASAATLNIISKAPMPSAPHGRIGEILNVLTYPQYRRQGLATQVLRLLLQKAADLALDRIDLLASPEGQALYSALGFSPLQDHLPMRLNANALRND